MKIFISIVFCFALAVSAFAQTNAQIEIELVKSIKEIQKYSTYAGNYDGEKNSAAQEAFEEKLLKYTKVSSTLQYKFTALAKLMHIATSDDGRFRIYSWDTEDGGTMHNYSRLYQYIGADGKVYSKTDAANEEASEEDEEDVGGGGSFVYDIFSLDAKGGKIYIVCSTFIASSNDHYQSANLYKIDGANLDNKVEMIKTKSGVTNTLNFEYNFFSVVDRKERPVRLISFDKKTKTLRIPVVIEDKEFPNGRVTSKFISYRFDGTYFVKVA